MESGGPQFKVILSYRKLKVTVGYMTVLKQTNQNNNNNKDTLITQRRVSHDILHVLINQVSKKKIHGPKDQYPKDQYVTTYSQEFPV